MCIMYPSFPSLSHPSGDTRDKFCESTAGVAEPYSGSHDEKLHFGGEGDEEDEEGGLADEEKEEERTHEHDGRTFEDALIADNNLIGLKHSVTGGGHLMRFAKACIEKEKRINPTRSPTLPIGRNQQAVRCNANNFIHFRRLLKQSAAR